MSLVHIAFKEGFQNDALVVRLNQAEVYRRADMKTRMQIGLAGSFELNAAPGPTELQVEVPTRKSSVTIPIEVPPVGDLYLAVSLSPDGAITYRSSEEPFRYA